ncbi:MAG: response regulator transcription factor [Saprospiraceae bacterium]|nr:response regulator transcription factor [Saprospiraceae bacterium]
MNKIQCIIVDDEPVAQRIIESYLTHFSNYQVLAKCKNAFEARTILISHAVDLMFLDIEMPQLKGLNFLRTLKQRPDVIVTTAHREFALESYELEVLDYLLKPISIERFIRSLNRFRSIQKLRSPARQVNERKYIFLNYNRKCVKVFFSEIQYIEGMSNYIKVKLSEETLIIYGTMSGILQKLDDRFLQVHRSYIINRDHLGAFTKEFVEINHKNIPVGKSFKKLINLLEQ